jgi:DNA primase
MFARLAQITGVGAAAPAMPANPQAAMRVARPGTVPKKSNVRTAIELLLQQPALALAIEPPYVFNVLDQPGIQLLVELINLCRSRPGIGTGAVLEHFEGRQEAESLHKLVTRELLLAPEQWSSEFVGSLKRLDLEALQQRQSELKRKQDAVGLSGLSDAEKDEQRGLLIAIPGIEAELRRLSAVKL